VNIGRFMLPLNTKISHRSRPPMAFDSCPSQPAGSGLLHRLVQCTSHGESMILRIWMPASRLLASNSQNAETHTYQGKPW